MGIASPLFRDLPLEDFGLEWIKPDVSVAHPLDNRPSVLLRTSLAETAEGLGADAQRYERLLRPFLRDAQGLIDDVLKPLDFPVPPVPHGPLRPHGHSTRDLDHGPLS